MIKTINNCPECGTPLPATGGCTPCERKRSAQSLLLVPLKGREPIAKRVQQVSTIAGAIILILVICVGGAYAFHREIANAMSGSRVPDPNETRVNAQIQVDKTIRMLDEKGKKPAVRQSAL